MQKKKSGTGYEMSNDNLQWKETLASWCKVGVGDSEIQLLPSEEGEGACMVKSVATIVDMK